MSETKKSRRATRRGERGSRRSRRNGSEVTEKLASKLLGEETEKNLEQTNKMWVPNDKGGFDASEFKEKDGDIIRVDVGGEIKEFKFTDMHPMNPPSLNQVPDMQRLTHLNEPSVLHNLKERYNDDKIYTYSGLFLVAINPYKNLPIYSKEYVERNQGRGRDEVPPHVFNLADMAYRNMLNTKVNQSMLVTGESGAGKTVNTKKIIQYLTTIAGNVNQGDVALEQQILRTNPLLEAFGNATTNRNDNSSRFGKFIEINFNASGFITGTKIDNYLLETTRVISQLDEDRNFHIFYQIFTDAELVKKFGLTKLSDYDYINPNKITVGTINDKKEFEYTRKSMEVIGFSKKEIVFAFSVIAAILHLGNLKFTDNNSGLAELKDKSVLKQAAKILGVSSSRLEKAMIKPKLVTATDVIDKHEAAKEGMFNKDALVEEMYKQLFNWIVSKINKSLTSKEAVKSFIGVLDIAGFEIFKFNSFEQLCINYTNEKLQQFFNQHMFKKEQELYLKEQIDWRYIDFGDDLQPTIDLIEKSGGILSLLDNQVFVRSNETKFVPILEQRHKDKPVFGVDKFDKMKFFLTHYAGTVPYDVSNWLTKNTDPMNDDCRETILSSKKALVRKLFKGGQGGRSKKTKGSRFKTVSKKYTESLDALMNVLNSTEPHFIRCIIPNSEKKPGKLDDKKVLFQLRCNGVLEGIRISRKGYPGRHTYAPFVKRFRVICDVFKLEKCNNDKEAAQLVVETASLNETKHYKLGLTKIFFKAGVEAKLEKLRDVEVDKVIITAQAAMRGALARKRLQHELDKISSCILIQDNWRSYHSLKNWAWWELFTKARPLISENRIEKEMNGLTTTLNELKNKISLEVAETQRVENEKAEIEAILKSKQDIIDGKKDAEGKVKQEMESVENNIKSLKSQIDALEKDKKKLSMEKEDLYNKEKEKLGDIEEKTKELEKLNKDLEELKAKYEDLKQQVEELADEKIKLTAETKDLDEQVQDKKQKLEYGNTNLGELKRSQGYLGEQIKEIKFKFGNKSKELNKNDDRLTALTEKLGETEDQLVKAKDDNELFIQNNTKKESQVSVLESDVENLNKKIENLKREEKTLQKNQRDLNDNINTTDTQRANSEKLLKNAREDVAELESRLAKLKDEQTNLKDSTGLLSDTITSMRNKLIDLEDDKLNLTKEKGDLGKKYGNLEFDHQELCERAERQLSLLNKKKDDIEKDLTQQLEDLNNAIASLKKKLKAGTSGTKDLKKEFDRLQAEKDNLENEFKKLEILLVQEQQNLVQEKKKTQEVGNKNKSLKSKIKDLESRIRAEGDDKKRISEKIKLLQAELIEKKESIEAVEKEITQLEGEKSDNSKALSKLKADLQNAKDQVNNLTNDVSAKETALNSLKNKIEEINILLSSLNTKTNDVNAKVLESNITLQTTQSEKSGIEKKLNKLKISNEGLEKKIKEKTREYNEENEEKIKLDGALRDVSSDLESVNLRLIDLKNKKKTHDGKLSELREKDENATQEERKLKSQKQVLESEEKQLSELSEELESRIIDLEAVLKELKAKVDVTERDTKELMQERLNLKNENRKTLNQISLQKELNEENSRKNKAQKENLKKRLENQEAENDGTLKKLADEKTALKKQNSVLSDKNKRSEDDDGVDKEMLSKIQTDYENQLGIIRTELEDERKEKLGSEASKRALQFKLSEAQDDLEQEERKRKKIDSKKKSLLLDMEELKELADEAEDIQDDLDAFKNESETKQTALKSDLQRERSSRQAAQTSLLKLKKEVAELERSYTSFKNETDSGSSSIEGKYTDELEDLENLLAKAKQDKKKASRVTKKVDRAMRETRRKIQGKEREKLTYEEKCASLEKELEKEEEEYLSISKRKSDLESKNKVAQRDLTSLKKKVQSCEDELQRARSEAKSSQKSKGKSRRRR